MHASKLLLVASKVQWLEISGTQAGLKAPGGACTLRRLSMAASGLGCAAASSALAANSTAACCVSFCLAAASAAFHAESTNHSSWTGLPSCARGADGWAASRMHAQQRQLRSRRLRQAAASMLGADGAPRLG